jgi:regulation of enolase protein 1 (concanavalin A-like superfamily)
VISIEVTFEHSPTNQYEQADLVWYLDDSNMVKLGEELVDGKLSVVMGREEKDKTRTVSITPLTSNKVNLRMQISRNGIAGCFRIAGSDPWTNVGKCELPTSPEPGARPKIAFQFYQGVSGSGHWARATNFRIINEGKAKTE